jgi:acetyl esterase/lipase
MRKIRAYIFKAGAKVFEVLGRLFLFSWFPPRVGDVIKDVRYGPESGKQSLDVFIPEGRGPFPVLVYIHGGGFHVMDKRSYRRLARYFASRGYVVFNVNYRMAPRYEFPVGLQNVALAVKWVHERARLYFGDPREVFLAGDSAGAYFSSMYGAAVSSPGLENPLGIGECIPAEHLKGLVLFYGAYDMETVLDTGFPNIELMSKGFFGYEPQVYEARAQIASPQRHVTGRYPPAFITSGERDSLHPQSVAFDLALSDAGVQHRTLFFLKKEHPLAYLWHGFVSVPHFKCSRMARREACAFMDERTSGPGT